MKLNGKKGENNHTVQHELYITGGIILLFVTIHFFNAFFNLELKFYDFMLRIKPDTPQNPAVLFVNIDDLALERLGAWPWSRDIIADALIRMRELGAAKAVFDIEYLSPSRLGINPEAAENLPQEFGALKDDLAQQINELTGAVGRGMLPPEYLPEAGEELVSYMDPLFDGLYDTVVSGLFRDNDRYFGEAIRFFGNAYLTINAARVNSSQDTELEAFAAEKFMLHPGDVSDPQGNIAAETVSFYRSQNMTAGITPAIYPVLEHARGAGFTNVILDGDGTLRRIGLLYEYQGNYVCQLVLSPLLDLLDTRSISRSGSRLTIRDALFPGESERRDISIPLDRDGTMYINWTRAQFDSSFRQESLYFLYYIDEVERNLLSAIRSLSSVRVRGNDGLHLSYFRAAEYLLASYDELGRRKARLLDGTDTDFNGYFAARKQFFEEVPFLLKPEMEEEALSRLTELSSLPEAATAAEHIGNAFNVIRSEYDLYRETFAELLSAYGGSFCILGNSATATTDLGTTPFHGSYPNVATHANVFNTIFLGEFIIPVSSWAGFAVAAALALIWTALGRRRAILFRNVSGGCGVLFFPLLFFSL
ncbi:MAG: CHASE2 domain-containing protein, partial [Spirochaetaceae bacterium]|nr:CHASE2 domain-containing protein [Spirochaetaceae bacterium]